MTPEEAQELKAGDMIINSWSTPIEIKHIEFDEKEHILYVIGTRDKKLSNCIYNIIDTERYIPEPKQCEVDTCTMVSELKRDLQLLKNDFDCVETGRKNLYKHNEQLKKEIEQLKAKKESKVIEILRECEGMSFNQINSYLYENYPSYSRKRGNFVDVLLAINEGENE